MTTVLVTTVSPTPTNVPFQVLVTAQTCLLDPIDAMEFLAVVASTARMSAAMKEFVEISGLTGTMTSRTLCKPG